MSILAILRYFRSKWRALFLSVVLAIAGAFLDAANVVLVVALADSVSKGTNEFSRTIGPITVHASTTVLAVLAVVGVLGSVVIVLAGNYVRARATASWARKKRLELLEAFLAAEWSLQSKDRAGRLQTNLGYLTYSASLITSLGVLARGIFGIIILIGTALIISPLAALGMLILGTFLFVVLRPLNRMVRRRQREINRLTKEMNENFGELSELAREIRIFGTTSQFQQRISSPLGELMVAERKSGTLQSAVTPIYQGIAFTVIVVALAIASRVGGVDVATLGAVALLVLRSVGYGQQFQGAYTGIQGATPALEWGEEALAELRAAVHRDGSLALDGVTEVQLQDVVFRYGEAEVALDHVDLHLHGGEIVGVVGPSGAGKSTLAQLLLRLRPAQSGTVTVNGTEVHEYSAASWARHVALVPQEPYLLHGSVFENIAFFRPDVDREMVASAAREAGIHDTILELDDGYDTPIGKSLRNMSGGQIQRIGIARALAGNPTMIVLDEPTSALDQKSEAIVQHALEDLKGKALVVVIAHRLTTLSICDRVVVMNGGHIEAIGDLPSVMAESAFFRSAAEQLALAGANVTTTALEA